MMEAYRVTRKDGAPGIDGVTAADYEANLEANLLDLLERIRSGRYRAPPVRRAYIPKADGSQRKLGIPTFEDKVAQRAVTMVLEAVYEQDFLPCSYGFRPGRSAHQALRTLQNVLWAKRLYWVLDIDIRKYFDSIPHSHLRTFLDRRVTDGVIRRMIDKWLKAGAVEDGLLRRTTEGSPQGGVISPCLSNVFLHHVLDEWFENEVRPRLRGDCTLVRFADDAVMAFDNIVDAQRVLAVLGKRLARFGLTLHPDKTRIVDFRPLGRDGARHPETDGTNFDFLGLTHVWGRSRNGKNMVRQVTAKSRFARAVAAVNDWCRETPPLVHPRPASSPVLDDAGPLRLLRRWRQHSTFALVRQSGRCGFGGSGCLGEIGRAWLRWDTLQRNPETPPAASSQDHPRIRRRERISLVKNRMREIRTSGSVRDGDGNVPIYSAAGVPNRRQVTLEGGGLMRGGGARRRSSACRRRRPSSGSAGTGRGTACDSTGPAERTPVGRRSSVVHRARCRRRERAVKVRMVTPTPTIP